MVWYEVSQGESRIMLAAGSDPPMEVSRGTGGFVPTIGVGEDLAVIACIRTQSRRKRYS